MFILILMHTPLWVWILLSALVALGLKQTRNREVSVARITVLPLAMVGLSLAGVLGAFGHLPVALLAWAVGIAGALVVAPGLAPVRGAAWSATTRRLHLPGSWLPLFLFVGLFAVKYGAGVSLAMHPHLASDSVFAGCCSFTYGAFSGLFLGRALPLRALAMRSPQRAERLEAA